MVSAPCAHRVHLLMAHDQQSHKSSVSLTPMTHAQMYRVEPPKATEAPEEHKKYIKEVLIAALNDRSAAHRLKHEDLWTIYSVRSQLLLSDNNRIWTMGALLVPTAFAAIGFAIIEPNATLSFYAWLGIPSVILLLFGIC